MYLPDPKVFVSNKQLIIESTSELSVCQDVNKQADNFSLCLAQLQDLFSFTRKYSTIYSITNVNTKWVLEVIIKTLVIPGKLLSSITDITSSENEQAATVYVKPKHYNIIYDI